MVKTFCWLRFGWFRHPSWAVGSFSSGKPAAGTRSTGGFDYPDWVILYHVTRAWIALVTWCSRIGILTKIFYGPSSFLQEKAPCKKKGSRILKHSDSGLASNPLSLPFLQIGDGWVTHLDGKSYILMYSANSTTTRLFCSCANSRGRPCFIMAPNRELVHEQNSRAVLQCGDIATRPYLWSWARALTYSCILYRAARFEEVGGWWSFPTWGHAR